MQKIPFACESEGDFCDANHYLLPWQIIVEAEFAKLHVGIVIIIPGIDDFEAEVLETIRLCTIEEALFFYEIALWQRIAPRYSSTACCLFGIQHCPRIAGFLLAQEHPCPGPALRIAGIVTGSGECITARCNGVVGLELCKETSLVAIITGLRLIPIASTDVDIIQ